MASTKFFVQGSHDERHWDQFARFIVRDFAYSEGALEEQKRELEEVDSSEKELWVSFQLHEKQP
jgi:hypothetical protein